MSGRPRRMARTAAAVATAANEELAKLSNSKKQEKEEVAKIEIARKAEIEEVQAPKQTKSRTRKAATAAAAAAAAASPQPVAIASTSARAGGGGGRGGGSKRGKKKEDIVQEVPEVSEETTTVEIPEDEQPEIVSTRGKATNRKRGTAAAAAAASKSKSTTTATGKNAQKLPVLIEEDGDADKSDPGPGPAAPATTTRRGRAVRKPIKSDDEIDHAPAKSTTSTSAATSSPAATRTRPTRTNARKAYEELPIEAEDEIVSKRGSRRSVVASSAGPSSSPSRTRKVAASKNVEKIATPKVTRKAAGKSKAQKIVTFNDDVAVEEITLFVASNDNSSNSSSNKDDNLASTSAATPSKTTSRTRSRGRSAKEAKSTEQISVSEQTEIPSTTTKRATRAKPQPAQVETPKRATGNRKRALPRENAADDDDEDAEDVVAKKIPAKEVEIRAEIIPTTITASTTTSTLPVVDLKSSEVVEKAQIAAAAAAVPEAKVDAVDELVLKKNVTNRQNARATRKVATTAAATTTTTTDETIIKQPLAEVPAVPVEKITAGTTTTTSTTTSTKTRGRRAAAAGKKVAALESASGDSDKSAAATTATTTIATSIITVSADDKPQADKQEPLADVKLAEIDPVSSSVLEEAKIKIAKSEKQAAELEAKEDKNEVISVSAVAGVDQVDQIPVVKAETLKRGKTTRTAAAAASAVTTGGRKKKQPIVPVKTETKPIEVAPKIEQATSESNDVPRPVAIATGITSTKQLIESEKSSSDEEKALIIVEDKTTAASAAAAAAAITTTTTTAVAMKPESEPEPEPESESKQQEIEAMEIDYHPEANSSSIDSSETAGQIESPLNATFVIEQNGHQSSATTTTTTTSIDSSTTSTTTITTITVAAAAASASTTTTTTTAISTGLTIGDIIGHSLVDELDRNNNNNSIAKDDEDNNNNNNGAEVDDNGGSGAKTIAGRKRKIEPNEEEAKIAMIDAKRVRIDAQDLVGDLFTLGEELVGELGPREKRYRGERVASHQPGRVKLPFRSRQVACGAYHTIVIAEDGRVITFGCNDDAALGRITSRSGSDNNNDKTIVENSDNNNNAANLEDAQNSDDDDDDDDDEDYEERMCRKPLPLGGGVITAKVVKVTAGDMHAAALDEDGNVFIWGNMKDESNKIGLFMDDEKQYSDYKPTRLPRQINIGGGETAANPRVIDIASGTHHFLMLTEDGRLFSMGEGSKGQLGRIDAARLTTITADRRLFIEPQLVKFDCSPAAKIVRIFASQWCSYALTGDGTLYGWGLNNYYQLGFKTTQPIEIDLDASMNTMSTLLAELFPVKIPIAISATDSALNSNNPNNNNKMASIVGISCGQQHVAALDSDGHVYTCGSVLYGKLGHGKRFVDESSDDISISAFKRIDSARFAGDPVTYVECGDFSTFAITESGRLYSWGQSSAHIGSAESGAAEHDRYEPTPITGALVDDVRFCTGSSGPQFAAWIGQFLSTAAPIDQ